MCECGCFGNLGIYKILSPNGFYRFVFSSECNYCGVGGSLVIEEITKDNEPYQGWENDTETLDLGKHGRLIACSLGIEETRETMKKAVKGYDSIDEYDAETLAECFIHHAPKWPIILKTK